MRISFKKLRVTVMGLGLHGGGLATALFFARRGARVTVTDLKDEKTLKSSLARIRELDIRLVLGGHEEKDFLETDLVIKNPAVPQDSPFLNLARERLIPVETDLSVFLSLSSSPLIAVTGSKGKSTTALAIHRCLKGWFPGARLGGNITVSPLSFLEELKKDDPVVLELSSWQLADLAGKGLPSPKISLMTVIFPDHQDRYPDMESYIADKKVIFQHQGAEDFAIFNLQDPFQKWFPRETGAKARFFSDRPLQPGLEGAGLDNNTGWIAEGGEIKQILEKSLSVPGEHNRLNLLAAGLAAHLFGLSPETIRASLRDFPGIEHRLEYIGEKNGLKFYNDSAATIPQALSAALKSLKPPVILIAGGTDKNLDFEPAMPDFRIPDKIVLLEGSASDKLERLLDRDGIDNQGPFSSLKEAFAEACAQARPGSSVLFSPGCASFEMFLNEFDRGRKFKELVRSIQ